MRLSEKTIEINFCSQFARRCRFPIIWFGLTQRQEAQLGFDVCTRIGGRLLILQFKASTTILRRSRRRQFHLAHDQMMNLQALTQRNYRSVFYVFPLIGTTLEVAHNPDIVMQSRLLDVARLPLMQVPTTKAGRPRRNGVHYADVNHHDVIIHSDPITVQLEDPLQFAESGFQGSDGLTALRKNSFEEFWQLVQLVPQNSIGAIIGRAGMEWDPS